MRGDAPERAALAALLLGCMLAGVGCSSTRSIEALPPRPAVAHETSAVDSPGSTSLARFEVRFRSVGTPLPEEVANVRLRVEDVRLHKLDGSWTSFPPSSGVLSLAGVDEGVRTILNTQISPARYDSVAIVFGGLFVEYSPNVGGPLEAASAPAAARAVSLDAKAGETVRVDLSLNPGASLARARDCSWHFLPFVTVEPRAGALP